MLLAEQVKRLDGFLGQAHDAFGREHLGLITLGVLEF
jgi:hypothetical protein